MQMIDSSIGRGQSFARAVKKLIFFSTKFPCSQGRGFDSPADYQSECSNRFLAETKRIDRSAITSLATLVSWRNKKKGGGGEKKKEKLEISNGISKTQIIHAHTHDHRD